MWDEPGTDMADKDFKASHNYTQKDTKENMTFVI